MSKNKIIGLVIWLVTLLGPMKAWMFANVGAGTTTIYLVMFLLTLTGVYVGSYFFSKPTASKKA